MTQPLEPATRRIPYDYRADALLISGHLLRPVELAIGGQANVSLNDRRGGHIVRRMEQFSADGLISFHSGYTRVSGGYSGQSGLVAQAASVLEDLNVFDVITAERVVAQMSAEHPYNGWIPKVTFLGTRFENLRVSGYAVQIELDLGICDKPEGGGPIWRTTVSSIAFGINSRVSQALAIFRGTYGRSTTPKSDTSTFSEGVPTGKMEQLFMNHCSAHSSRVSRQFPFPESAPSETLF